MKRITLLRWFGMACGIAGAMTVAAHVSWSGYGFVLFLAGNLFWITAGFSMREPSIWILNGTWGTINLFGIYRWLLAW